MLRERVVITGCGLISPLGLNAATHFQRLLHGESAVGEVNELGPARFQTCPAAQVTGFDRTQLITNRMLRKLLSPAASYAVAAAGEAIRGAGLAVDDDRLRGCGLFVGSIAIDIDPEVFIPAFRESLNQSREFEMARFATRGIKLLDPLFLVKALPNAGVCGISIQYQVLGSNVNITNGPLSGLQAVASAAAAIRRGEITLAVAGGYDSLLRMDCVAEHLLSGRLARGAEPRLACRPFDLERDGLALGEGAAFVLLEARSQAQARGATIYGELLGIGQTTDATLLTQPDTGDGLALEQAARQALGQSGCSRQALGIVFGDGLATVADDAREGAVFRRLVEDGPALFTAATGALGFAGAASGAFSLVHAIMALHQQVVPPLVNCRRPDPRCAVPFVATARHQPVDRVLVWNSDHGVKNIALVVGAGGRTGVADDRIDGEQRHV